MFPGTILPLLVWFGVDTGETSDDESILCHLLFPDEIHILYVHVHPEKSIIDKSRHQSDGYMCLILTYSGFLYCTSRRCSLL